MRNKISLSRVKKQKTIKSCRATLKPVLPQLPLILASNLPILVPVVAPFAELRLSAKGVAYIDSQAEIAVVDSCAVGAIEEI